VPHFGPFSTAASSDATQISPEVQVLVAWNTPRLGAHVASLISKVSAVQPSAKDQGQRPLRRGAPRRVTGQSLAGGKAVGVASIRSVCLIPIDMNGESVHIH
jgi:hypothetical protein